MSEILYVIVGPNGSGKSSTINETDFHNVCQLIINPDNHVNHIPDILGIEERYVMAMNYCAEVREGLLSSGVTFGFETVGSREDKLEFINRAKEKGYWISILFVTTSDPKINIGRIHQRVAKGGHDVPEEKVRNRYERTMNSLSKYLELADDAVVLDNSKDSPEIVIEKENGKVIINDTEENPSWIRKYL